MSSYAYKREQYRKLVVRLDGYLKEHGNLMDEIDTYYKPYIAQIVELDSSKIPADDFEPKRKELTIKLEEKIKYEGDKHNDLQKARNIAHSNFLKYERLAELEEAENASMFW